MKKMSAKAYFFKKTIDFFMVGLLVVFLLFIWTLYRGPISVPYLRPYIVQALNYDENEYTVDIGDVNIELVRSIQPLRVTAKEILLKKNDDTVSISAPKLYLSFSLRALIKGIIAPSDVSLENPTVYVFASYGVEEEHKNEANKKKLEFYVNIFKDFLSNYNSEEKIYPESFVNNISVKGGEVEFHEVDLGRKWILSDLDFEFSRNFINLEVNANALVNINDKIASAGFEGTYHASDDILDAEVYFSDLILSDMMSTFNETTEDNILSSMSIEVPVNGKVSTTIKLADILAHPDEASDYIDGAVEKIEFELDSGHGLITFENEEKYNYEVDELQVSGKVTGGIDEIHIENAEFKLGGQNATFDFEANGLETYYMEHSLKDAVARFTVKVKEFALTDLSRFWPRYFAEPGWEWCKDGLIGGTAKNGKFIFDFGYKENTQSWGLVNLDGKAELTDGDIFYLEGMPVVHNVYGTAHFTDHNILIDIDKGINDGVIITGGKVDIYDLNKEDNFILIDLIGNSSVTDALNLINNPPLEFAKEIGLKPEKIKGNVDLALKLDFELRQDLQGKDIKVDVKADLHNVEIPKLIDKHGVGAKEMKLYVNSAGWGLSGEGSFENIPIILTMDEKFADKNYKSRSKIVFKLDEAAKKALGIDWKIIDAPNIEGYATVNADVIIKENDVIDININADLQNNKIDYAYFGFVKPKGEPAQLKAHAIVKNEKLSDIPSISLSKTGVNISGNIKMYPSGRVKLVDIDQISGAKTSAKAKVSLTDTEMPRIKIDVSGSSFDLTPLFDKSDDKKTNTSKTVVKQENEDDGLEEVNDMDIFITVHSLWTNKTTPIQNFAGSAKLKHGVGLDEVHLVGNYGIDKSIKVNLDYTPRGNKEHYLSIDSNNAGSTLKVLRLYDNMVGGNLKIEARRDAQKKFIGHAAVRDFSIQDAPVIAKLLSVASFTGMLDLLKGDGLTFTHFSAPFEYQYKILTLKKAQAEGNVVGITTIGTYNRATDDIKFHGVIAPAYSLNRFLGKIPVVGNLLASKDGTIFAADYKINGSSDEPDVDINSLSILSPNSMKEWYNENFGDSGESW